MAAGEISWFRYQRHGGLEREVGPNDMDLPAHHSHYSFLQEIEMSPTDLLIQERHSTHGDFAENARISQEIKALFTRQMGWELLTPVQRESLDMIALKLSRILSGKPDEQDHWDDIAGYARLASTI
jgi:hypothetical protein